MKWIKIVLYLLIVTLTIIQFNGLENYLINSKISWSFSKLAPYLTLLLGGILIAIWFRKYIVMPRTIKNILFWLILVIPFVVGFVFNPIYEGDFSVNGQKINKEIKYSDFLNADLVVITIPGCPFCHESVGTLKKMKERNPNMRIRMVVCSSDVKALEPYKESIGDAFDLQLASDGEKIANVADMSFPTFVLVKNNLPTEKWSNDQFGAGAKDVFEKYFKI